MRRQPVTRRLLIALVGSSAVGLAAGAALAQPAPSDLVDKGRYLATAGDCVACHTAPGGKPFAGGLYINFPGGIGKLATPNITPDKETGIGSWSDDDFKRAMHEGITKSGSYLYPAFPFPWYTRLTDEDVRAIKAYLFSLEPVNAPRKPADIAFPFSIREGLLAWRLAFFTEGRFKPDPKASEQVNRGAYLVEGPAIAVHATTAASSSAPRSGAAISRAARSTAGTRPTCRATTRKGWASGARTSSSPTSRRAPRPAAPAWSPDRCGRSSRRA